MAQNKVKAVAKVWGKKAAVQGTADPEVTSRGRVTHLLTHLRPPFSHPPHPSPPTHTLAFRFPEPTKLPPRSLYTSSSSPTPKVLFFLCSLRPAFPMAGSFSSLCPNLKCHLQRGYSGKAQEMSGVLHEWFFLNPNMVLTRRYGWRREKKNKEILTRLD